MHRRLGGVAAATVCEAFEDDDGDEDAPVIESFEELQRFVIEGIESGELAPDDPRVVQYREACRRARGSSGRGFVGDAQLQEKMRSKADEDWVQPDREYIEELQRSSAGASGSAVDEYSGAGANAEPERPPADDPFAVEEGDPFADDE
ncbi:MAG: hypothetical protein GF393_00155 [Armatimonadia bacterium]|nr:hypothetical protein [Armatimonadia bacterium]